MAFMVPQYHKTEMWSVETTSGTELVPIDLVTSGSMAGLRSFLEGTPLSNEKERVAGWFCRLSAPGYMDCTEWSGPYATEDEARKYITEQFDVDPDTGDDLDEVA